MLIWGTTSFSQMKTYLGVEVAATHDVYDLVDHGDGLKNIPRISGLWGFTFRQDLNPFLFLEAGFLRKYYNEGIGLKVSSGYSETNAINAWYIPLRLGYRINVCKEKIVAVPLIGYSICINSDYGYGDGGGASMEQGLGYTASYNYISYYNLTKTFPLLQTGMGIEFQLLKTALLTVSANYYTGFKKVIALDINYTVNNSPQKTAHAFSKGENFSIGVDLKYPISKFWGKSKR